MMSEDPRAKVRVLLNKVRGKFGREAAVEIIRNYVSPGIEAKFDNVPEKHFDAVTADCNTVLGGGELREAILRVDRRKKAAVLFGALKRFLAAPRDTREETQAFDILLDAFDSVTDE